jgi:hypothetical protein
MTAEGPKDDPLRFATTSPEQYARLTEAVSQLQREPGHLVVLGRQRTMPEAPAIKAFAEALGLDPFSARQKLLLPTPRVLRREERAGKAREWTEWLHKLGMRAFDVEETIIASQQFLLVHSLEFAPDGDLVVNLAAGGEPLVIPASDLLALVHGEVNERVDVSDSSSNPLLGEVRSGKENIRSSTEAMTDIHRRSTPDSLRIAQDSFHWQALHPGELGQSSRHARELFESLRKAFPAATVYGDFATVESVLGESERLIASSSHFWRNDLRPATSRYVVHKKSTTVRSNRTTFETYSTLARLDALKG